MPLPQLAPVATSRIMVREISVDDLPDLMAVNGDPEVTRFLPYATWQSIADARAWFERMNALALQGTARQLVMVRQTDQKAIGTALLFKYDEGSQRVELGYALGRAHWHQGYASEALVGLLSQLFEAGHIRRVEAEVNPDNIASNALLHSLGFVQEGHLRDRWTAKGVTYGVNIYGLLSTDWHARRQRDGAGTSPASRS